MSNLVIGLDFGTYQTKVSINYLDKKPQKHEFFLFNLPESKSLFLPSKVFLLQNGLLEYGYSKNKDVKYEFDYFKMASVDDEKFKVLNDEQKGMYKADNYYGYSPEFISILFLTFTLLTIKQKYNNEKGTENVGRGLFSSLKKVKKSDNKFYIRMGIPTEYSKSINYKRRVKFEIMLLISEMIQEKLDYSLDKFLSNTIDYYKETVLALNEKIPFPSSEEYKVLMKKYNLSIFPENAAGLLYFIKSGRLEKGRLYAAIDIGGGTTDISFFNVRPDGKIEYYTSGSFQIACNNIYMRCAGKGSDLKKLKSTEEKILKSIENGTWLDNNIYVKAVKAVKQKLSKELKTMIISTFDHQLKKFSTSQLLMTLKNQPVILYGGGVYHPLIKHWKEILIFDNGDPTSSYKEMHTYMKTRDVNKYRPSDSKVLNEDKIWKQNFPLLIVAFGLSNIDHPDDTYWDETNYENIPDDENLIVEVPHPVNEGMYIYKTISRKWERSKFSIYS